ncbi:cellular retinoic acid-binding protein 2b [Trichomycterus rosablanca]|uniref:cellular retinoic acid-binding protein 2b n=1 Tax=Trichomycterus rosablanca TaxID=2290929 RepID=UPI002F35D991
MQFIPDDVASQVRKSENHMKSSFDPGVGVIGLLFLMCVCVCSVGVNVFLRKIAVAAASRPSVEIKQDGETLSIQTSTSVRTTQVSFTVGETFNETTVDGRPCTSFPKWETDRKISCEQTLVKGEGPKTSWTRELNSDGQLILTMSAGDVECTRMYERE